jgi:hypothetical protein
MEKNLIISAVGDESLHRYWTSTNHDLFLVYYGDNEKNKKKYKKQATHYCELKGTKFNIVHELYNIHKDTIDKYKYIFIPDDDIFMHSRDITKLFEITKEYNLLLSQPAIIGYYSIGITLPVACLLLRLTNFVEIMCPCFEISAFQKLHHSFNYNKSCWGIDLIWNAEVNQSEDKIGIIDDIIGIHTRPVSKGDSYSNNNIENPYDDTLKICDNYNVTENKITYKNIPKNIVLDNTFPNLFSMKKLCDDIRIGKNIKVFI